LLLLASLKYFSIEQKSTSELETALRPFLWSQENIFSYSIFLAETNKQFEIIQIKMIWHFYANANANRKKKNHPKTIEIDMVFGCNLGVSCSNKQ
jgi:hypothetical protein